MLAAKKLAAESGTCAGAERTARTTMKVKTILGDANADHLNRQEEFNASIAHSRKCALAAKAAEAALSEARKRHRYNTTIVAAKARKCSLSPYLLDRRLPWSQVVQARNNAARCCVIVVVAPGVTGVQVFFV